MKKKKIHILYAISPKTELSELYGIREQFLHLDEEKYQAYIVLFSEKNEYPHPIPPDIPVKTIRLRRGLKFLFPCKLAAFFKENQPDIIHSYGFSALLNVFYPGKKSGIPLIHSHNTWLYKKKKNKFIKRILRFTEEYILKQASLVLVSSKRLKKEAEKAKLENLMLFYPAVRTEFVLPDFPGNKGARLFTSNSTIIGYISNPENPGWDTLILKSIQILIEKNIPVTLIVRPAKGNKEKLNTLIHELGLETEVFICCRYKETVDLFKSVDIICLTSTEEQEYGILPEAMSVGTAVILTDTESDNEYVSDGRNGLIVKEENPEKLADAIYLMYTDKELRYILIRNAYKFAKKFRSESVTQKLEYIYASQAKMDHPTIKKTEKEIIITR